MIIARLYTAGLAAMGNVIGKLYNDYLQLIHIDIHTNYVYEYAYIIIYTYI